MLMIFEKLKSFPSSGRVDTAVRMHYLDANKRMEKKLISNYTKMLQAILDGS